MGVTRMGFIQGALASLGFGAMVGRRLFAAPPGWMHGGVPNLVFGGSAANWNEIYMLDGAVV